MIISRYAIAGLLLTRTGAFNCVSKPLSRPNSRLFMSSSSGANRGGSRSIQRVVAATVSNPMVTRLVGTVDIDGKGTEHPLSEANPFILLDVASITKNNKPPFGAHPHRGHSVVTVLMRGSVKSWDTFSNTETVLKAPASYWVDAGSGLFHNEVSVIENEGDASQHVGLLQLWIGVKEEDRLKPPRVQHYENVPMEDILGDNGKVVGKVQYYVGGSKSSVETPHPIVVAHVRQDASTIHRFPIDPSHGGFIINLNGSNVVDGTGSEEYPASFGGTTPTTANDILVLDIIDDGTTQAEYLKVQTNDSSADYMVVVGELIDESWAKKLVANGAVIAATPEEAREIASKVEGYAAAGKAEGGSFAPFGV